MTQAAPRTPHSIAVTGANGQLGRALLRRLAAEGSHHVRALVRSQRARDSIEALALQPEPEIRIVDYACPEAMEAALSEVEVVVHLVGIIKETAQTRYEEAHEQTCQPLSLAAHRAGASRIIYLSILGSSAGSPNPCLASKGRAEDMLIEGPVPATILRVPMVLGGDDAASASLRRQARAKRLRLVGGGRTLQQPIDARDVVSAILAAAGAAADRDLVLDAGGPTCLPHRDLVLHAARLYGNTPRVGSIPASLARSAVRVLERILPNPPISLAMFDILQHDDQVETQPFCQALGMTLTPLEQTLADHVGPDRETDEPATPANGDQGDRDG